jgi:prevent-host-death family protein
MLSQPTHIREVSVRQLTHQTSRVLGRVEECERVIVSRYGRPVAVLLGIDQAIDLLLANSEEFVRMRVAAREELAAGRTFSLERFG